MCCLSKSVLSGASLELVHDLNHMDLILILNMDTVAQNSPSLNILERDSHYISWQTSMFDGHGIGIWIAEADPGSLEGGGGRDRREPKTFLQDRYKLEKGADCAHTALCTAKPLFL